jgi:hypothetical protein
MPVVAIVVPLPSWPIVLLPQHTMIPDARSAHVWSPPAAICTIPSTLPWHTPETHVAPAGHVLLHTPQLALLDIKLISQPSESRALQLPNPGWHAVRAHMPAVQAAVPFAKSHRWPHAPQFSTPVGSTHEPSRHMRFGVAHAPTHRNVVPALKHMGVVPPQFTPHAPQFIAVSIGVSQPFIASRSQSAKPGRQVSPHIEKRQVGSAFERVGHEFPHVPQ